MDAFSSSACFRLKLLRVLETAGQRVLTYALQCGTSGKSPSVPLDDYLKNLPCSSKAKFITFESEQKRKFFTKTDKKQIRGDITCSTFDITLLWKAIAVACEGWQDPSNSVAESLVTKIRDERNEVVHGAQMSITEEEFLNKLGELHGDLIKALEATRVKYSADGTQCDNEKIVVSKLIDNIRHENLSEKEIWQRSASNVLPIFKMEAGLELAQRLNSARLLDPLRFLGGHEGRRVDVQDIFSRIIIKEETNEQYVDKTIHYSKLLTHTRNGRKPDSPHLLMVEGDAGSGKTTLLTFTLSEYLKETNRRMEGLDHYDMLLWIVCREENSTTLGDLLKTLLPEAYFKYGNLLLPLLKRSSALILIDGLDEQNEDSRRLIIDILNQSKDCPTVTLLSTSRPEGIQAMKAITPKNFQRSHLKLDGITTADRTEVALRHYRWLCAGESRDDAHLRQVMEQIVWKELFRLPLNLLFLATFFYYEPQKVATSITQTELYQHILDWCTEKLRQRLVGRSPVQAGVFLQVKVTNFLIKSFEIALKGLLQGKIYLSDEDLIHLTDLCSKEDLPKEEVFSAFYSLRRGVTGGVTKEHYFTPHKGLQDFFAARHILARLNNYKMGDIHRVLEESSQGKDLHLESLRNMLCHLLGLLSSQNKALVTAMEETVDLIQESGMSKADDWLSLLADTEASPATLRRVAHHISMLSTKAYPSINVSDGTIRIASALLPLIPSRDVSVKLQGNEKEEEVFLKTVAHHTLIRLDMEHHFRHSRTPASSAHLLHQFPRSGLRAFAGNLNGEHLTLLPRAMNSLYLAITGDGHAQNLMPSLEHIYETFPGLRDLNVHVPVSAVIPSSLTSLPSGSGVSVFLSGVDAEKVEVAVNVAAALCPREIGYSFITFPGASIGVAGWTQVLEDLALAGVDVDDVCIPETTASEDKESLLKTLAKCWLGCELHRVPEEDLFFWP